MSYLKALSGGSIPEHVRQAIERDVTAYLSAYCGSRHNDVDRGAETAEVAGAFIAQYVAGMDRVLSLMGIDMDLVRVGDAMIARIDPDFEQHKHARWAARPCGFTMGQ
jgi:hypothetical protein